MITLIVFTNGRDDLLAKTLESFQQNVNGPVTKVIVNDDTDSLHHLNKIKNSFSLSYETIQTVEFIQSNRAGFNGSIQHAWDHYKQYSTTPFIFHLEDDFTFNREVDLWDMMGILDSDSTMAQLALMRQPWNQAERDAGGLYKLFPNAFKQQMMMNGSKWLTHNEWFTTNPSLYRRQLVREFSWPQGSFSEGNFTHKVREEGYHFGYMGSILDEPWVTHIGFERATASHGY